MRWLGWIAVVVIITGGCGRFGSEDDQAEGPVGVGSDLNVPTVVPGPTLDRPGVPVSTAPGDTVGTTSAPGGAGEAVPSPPTVAGPANPCAGRSERPGHDNVAERTDDSTGLVVRITLAPTLCLDTNDEINVAVDVVNRSSESRYVSSRRPVVVVFANAKHEEVWSSCNIGRASPGNPPDVPVEVPPAGQERLAVITYKPSDTSCGRVRAGIHTAMASVQTCTAADAADRVCDEKAIVPVPTPGMRFEVR